MKEPMYVLFIEVNSYRQLTRLRPSFAQDIIRGISHSLSGYGGALQKSDAGCLFFSFPTLREGEHLPMVEAADAVGLYLGEQEDELFGYSAIVDFTAQSDIDTLFREMRGVLRRLPTDNGVWIGPTASVMLLPFVEAEQEDGYYRVTGRQQGEPTRLGDVRDFASIDYVAEAILDLVAPWLSGEEEAGFILVHGNELSGTRYNVTSAVQTLYHGVSTVHPPVLFPSELEESALRPLVNSLRDSDLENVPPFLSLVEKAVWTGLRPVIDDALSEPGSTTVYSRPEQDFLNAYSLYLRATFRNCREQLVPPFLIVEDCHRVPARTFVLLEEMLNELPPQHRPMLILVSDSAEAPIHLQRPHRGAVAVPPLEQNEIAERADGYLTESAKRSMRLLEGMYRTEGLPVALFHHFLNVQNRRTEGYAPPSSGAELDPLEETWTVVSHLEQSDQELFYVIHFCQGGLHRELLLELLEELGFLRLRIPDALRGLVKLGLLRDEASLLVLFPGMGRRLEQRLGEAAKRLGAAVRAWVVQNWRSGHLRMTPTLLSILETGDEFASALDAYRDLVSRALDVRDFDVARDLLYTHVPFVAKQRPADELSELKWVLYTLRLRLALMSANKVEAQRLYDARRELPDRQPSRRSVADRLLEEGRHMFAIGNLPQATAQVKRAVMLYQDEEEPVGINRANTEFGLIVLAQENLQDARDYFLMARSHVHPTVESYHLLRTTALELASTIISGNLSRAQEQLSSLFDRAADYGLHEWQLILSLIKGRIHFELGKYEDALLSFVQAMAPAQVHGYTRAQTVFRSWAARCLLYMGHIEEATRRLSLLAPSPENLYFLAEAYERCGAYTQALSCLETAGAMTRPFYRPGEALMWSGGFTLIEDLAIGRTSADTVLSHLVKAFQGYLLALSGDVEEGISQLHRLTREQKVSPIDPYNWFYYYLYSIILPGTRDPDTEDKLTILGKAVKHAQERTSRIENYGDKTSYLNNNYWNRRLMDEAREHNLI